MGGKLHDVVDAGCARRVARMNVAGRDASGCSAKSGALIARSSRGRRRPALFADVRETPLTCRDRSPASAPIRSERTYKQEVVGSIPAAPTIWCLCVVGRTQSRSTAPRQPQLDAYARAPTRSEAKAGRNITPERAICVRAAGGRAVDHA